MKDAVTILNRYGFDATVADDGCLTINNEIEEGKQCYKEESKEQSNGNAKGKEDQNAVRES